MGRPQNCACCGTQVQPSSVCEFTTNYFGRPWEVQASANTTYNLTSLSGISYNEWPLLTASGEMIRLNYLDPNFSSSTYTIDNFPPFIRLKDKWGWWQPPVDFSQLYCGWLNDFDLRDEFYNSGSGYLNYYNYDYCLDKMIPMFQTYNYNYIITKQAYFESGVWIYGGIRTYGYAVNAQITINDGIENNIFKLYDYNNDAQYGCIDFYGGYGLYKTQNSGCFKITVSGSTDWWSGQRGSGYIDFFILPSANSMVRPNSQPAEIKSNTYLIYDLNSSLPCSWRYGGVTPRLPLDLYSYSAWDRICWDSCARWVCCYECPGCVCEADGSTAAVPWWISWQTDQVCTGIPLSTCDPNVTLRSSSWNPLPPPYGGGLVWSSPCWPRYGACCYPDGTCQDSNNQLFSPLNCKTCADAGGTWTCGGRCVDGGIELSNGLFIQCATDPFL